MEKAEEIVKGIKANMEGRMPHLGIRHLYTLKERMGENCRNYLEIGTYHGASLSVVLQSKYRTNFYSIDLFEPTRDRLGNYVGALAPSLDIARANVGRFNPHNHPVKLIKGSSRDRKTLKQLKDIRFDFLFIDGDHSEQAVLSDFRSYYPLLNEGAYIVFDDYDYESVQRAVTNILRRYASVQESEILDNEYVMQKQATPSRNVSTILKQAFGLK